MIKDITVDIDNNRFYLAAEKAYHYVWHTFADKIIEENKARLLSEDIADQNSAKRMLFSLLEKSLIILHPFMPFITEEIWAELPNRESQLIVTKWPTT